MAASMGNLVNIKTHHLKFVNSLQNKASVSRVLLRKFSNEASVQYGAGPVGRVMQKYEDVVGLTEVKQAQDKVISAEQHFLKVQEERRVMQQELVTVQSQVRTLGAELEKTSRTDSRYIDLVKQEHEILKVETDMTNKIKLLDKSERDYFSQLSAAVRESHEKERARAERTKYWSVIGSVVGAILGIAGSTINNRLRMKEMRAIISDSGSYTAEYKAIADRFFDTLSVQQPQIDHLVIDSEDTDANSNNNNQTQPVITLRRDDASLSQHTQLIVNSIQKQTADLQESFDSLQRLVGLQKAVDNDGNIVYVGPEMNSLLSETEGNIVQKIRKNNLLAAVAFTSVTALAISILTLFRGS